MVVGKNDINFMMRSAILNHDNRLFEKCLRNPYFNINERFCTTERDDENYLNYAFIFNNYYAASRLLDLQCLYLNDDEKQRMIKMLRFRKQFLLLFVSLYRMEKHRVPVTKIINGVVTGNYKKIK